MFSLVVHHLPIYHKCTVVSPPSKPSSARGHHCTGTPASQSSHGAASLGSASTGLTSRCACHRAPTGLVAPPRTAVAGHASSRPTPTATGHVSAVLAAIALPATPLPCQPQPPHLPPAPLYAAAAPAVAACRASAAVAASYASAQAHCRCRPQPPAPLQLTPSPATHCHSPDPLQLHPTIAGSSCLPLQPPSVVVTVTTTSGCHRRPAPHQIQARIWRSPLPPPQLEPTPPVTAIPPLCLAAGCLPARSSREAWIWAVSAAPSSPPLPERGAKTKPRVRRLAAAWVCQWPLGRRRGEGGRRGKRATVRSLPPVSPVGEG